MTPGRIARTTAGRLREAGRAIVERASETLHPHHNFPPGEVSLGRGAVFSGTVWAGGAADPIDGAVVLDERGIVTYLGSRERLPDVAGLDELGGPECWIGPGIVDAHVHLAFGSPEDMLRAGLVAVRDLGAPQPSASAWRTGHAAPVGVRPVVAVSGPIITAVGGYPSQSWGRDGFAVFASSPPQARQLVHRLAAAGADLIKIALEPGDDGWPVPEPGVVRAVVDASHDSGLAVVAHALRVEMVRRAIDAGVDELAHTPTERMSAGLVDRIADAGVSVVSTLQTFFSAGVGRSAGENAADLHAAGVRLRYGTDLGNGGTRPGVDPRELDRLADAGLGRLGALRAATEYSAQAPGIRRRTGLLQVGSPAALVLLAGNPLDEPGVWRTPTAVVADGRLLVNAAPHETA